MVGWIIDTLLILDLVSPQILLEEVVKVHLDQRMSSSAFSVNCSPSRSVTTLKTVDRLDDSTGKESKLSQDKGLWIQYQKERLHPGLSKQSSWPKLNTEQKVTFCKAGPASLPAPSSSPSFETAARSTAKPTMSKWRRFMHSLKKNKLIQVRQ